MIILLNNGAGNDIGDKSVDPNTHTIGDGIDAGPIITLIRKLANSLAMAAEHRNVSASRARRQMRVHVTLMGVEDLGNV